MNRDLFERDVLIVETNNGKEKKIRESYKLSEKGMRFDVKTDIDGQINETSGVLTNQDIEDMFSPPMFHQRINPNEGFSSFPSFANSTFHRQRIF